MNIIRYHKPEIRTPFDRLENLREEVNRLFEGSLPGWGSGLLSGWNPALDITEDKENVYVKVELPGMKKEEIDLSLHDNVLTLSGERKQEKREGEGKAVREERIFGRFQRNVALPAPVTPDGVKAVYRDGLLTVELPKAEEAKPKQIEVNID